MINVKIVIELDQFNSDIIILLQQTSKKHIVSLNSFLILIVSQYHYNNIILYRLTLPTIAQYIFILLTSNAQYRQRYISPSIYQLDFVCCKSILSKQNYTNKRWRNIHFLNSIHLYYCYDNILIVYSLTLPTLTK